MQRAEERRAAEWGRLDSLLEIARPVYAFQAQFTRSIQSKLQTGARKVRQQAYARTLKRARDRMKAREGKAEPETPRRGRWLTQEEAMAKFPGNWVSPN